jgi:hypothetical protein
MVAKVFDMGTQAKAKDGNMRREELVDSNASLGQECLLWRGTDCIRRVNVRNEDYHPYGSATGVQEHSRPEGQTAGEAS